MNTISPRRNKEEIARLGNAIYNDRVKGQIEPGHNGKFAAVDIETGDYEVDDDERMACVKLRERIPSAEIWLVRVGSQYLHRFGYWS